MEEGDKSLGCLKSSWKCFSHLLLSAKTGLPLWQSMSPVPALLPPTPKAPAAPAPCFGGCRDFPPGGTCSIFPVDPWAKPYPNPTICTSLSPGFWLVWGVRDWAGGRRMLPTELAPLLKDFLGVKPSQVCLYPPSEQIPCSFHAGFQLLSPLMAPLPAGETEERHHHPPACDPSPSACPPAVLGHCGQLRAGAALK